MREVDHSDKINAIESLLGNFSSTGEFSNTGITARHKQKLKIIAYAVKYGLKPLPKSRKAIWKLLLAKYGIDEAKIRLRHLGLEVPKDREFRRGKRSLYANTEEGYQKRLNDEYVQWLKDIQYHPLNNEDCLKVIDVPFIVWTMTKDNQTGLQDKILMWRIFLPLQIDDLETPF